jgi:enoyl-CoA hydratase
MEFVTLSREGPVSVVSIERPARRNALGHDVRREFVDAMHEAQSDRVTRAVVVTGSGGVFSAGADTKEFGSTALEMTREVAEFLDWVTLPERMPIPVIAAVNGPALGGGFELAMCCDCIVAGESATFGLPESKLGLIPGLAVQRLPRLIGVARARELLLTACEIDASTAASWGLAAVVVSDDELMSRALAMGRAIAELAPLALEAIKSTIAQAWSLTDIPLASRTNGLLYQSSDSHEARQARKERRAAVFEGR